MVEGRLRGSIGTVAPPTYLMPANAFASAWLGRAMAMAKKLWFMLMVHGAYMAVRGGE